MKTSDIIDTLRSKLGMPGGRHLYAVLGNYKQLENFAHRLKEASQPEGGVFPDPINVNRGILDSIPDDEFRELVEYEARRPEPTAKHVDWAFEKFLRAKLQDQGLIILANMEMLFAYHLELRLLRTMAADDHRIILLLPGKRTGNRVIMFPENRDADYTLPTNLVADNHTWEITD